MIINCKGDLLNCTADIICHQVNCRGVMGAGLAKQIRCKWPAVYDEYKKLCNDIIYKLRPYECGLLGTAQMINIGDGRYVANLFAQIDYGTDSVKTNMTALKYCIKNAKHFIVEHDLKTIAFPKYIGCGLAGGDWTEVYRLIKRYFGKSKIKCYIVEKA